jgi:phage gpG-like protein
MSKFNIELTPESRRIVDGLAKAGKIDLRPVMNVIGIGYRKEVKAIFGKKQARGEGDKWPQLSDKYAAWKEKKYPGAPLLVRTGALRASMTELGAQGNINIIGKVGAVFGSTVFYGVFHDVGGERVPRRNFSEPNEARKQIWLDQIERSLRKNFEDNGVQVSGSLVV